MLQQRCRDVAMYQHDTHTHTHTQVTLRTLTQHQRELLHALEIETLQVRAGDDSKATDAYLSAVGALQGDSGAGAAAVHGHDAVAANTGVTNAGGAAAGGAHTGTSGGAQTLRHASLEQRIQGLRQTFQRYAVVDQRILQLEVEIGRLRGTEAQQQAMIAALEQVTHTSAAIGTCMRHFWY